MAIYSITIESIGRDQGEIKLFFEEGIDKTNLAYLVMREVQNALPSLIDKAKIKLNQACLEATTH